VLSPPFSKLSFKIHPSRAILFQYDFFPPPSELPQVAMSITSTTTKKTISLRRVENQLANCKSFQPTAGSDCGGFLLLSPLQRRSSGSTGKQQPGAQTMSLENVQEESAAEASPAALRHSRALRRRGT